MIKNIRGDLREIITNILDEKKPRELEKVVLEFHTNIGERFVHHCPNIKTALKLLSNFNFSELLDTTNSPAIFDT